MLTSHQQQQPPLHPLGRLHLWARGKASKFLMQPPRRQLLFLWSAENCGTCCIEREMTGEREGGGSEAVRNPGKARNFSQHKIKLSPESAEAAASSASCLDAHPLYKLSVKLKIDRLMLKRSRERQGQGQGGVER